MNIHAGIGNKVHAAHLQDAHQTNNISVIVAVHGSGVGSGDHIAHSGLVGAGGNSLQTTGSLIVDLIAVNIDELIVLLSQIEANVEGLNRVLTGELEVRDSTGSVGAHLQGVFQQLFALGIAEDTILGEGDDLDIHEILDFVAQFQQRFHSGQLGIVDINMGTNMLDTIGGLHTDGLIDAILNFLLGEEGLILFPALDAFKQSAAHVPAGTAGGEAGIQVDMGLDDGGPPQSTTSSPGRASILAAIFSNLPSVTRISTASVAFSMNRFLKSMGFTPP